MYFVVLKTNGIVSLTATTRPQIVINGARFPLHFWFYYSLSGILIFTCTVNVACLSKYCCQCAMKYASLDLHVIITPTLTHLTITSTISTIDDILSCKLCCIAAMRLISTFAGAHTAAIRKARFAHFCLCTETVC